MTTGMRHPYGQTITCRRIPRDDRGDPTGEPPEIFEISGCAIERLATVEQSNSVGGVPTDDQRDIVITTMKVFLPPDSGLRDDDWGSGADLQLWLPGEDRTARPRWRLSAKPYQARNPFTGHYPGDEIQIERVDG